MNTIEKMAKTLDLAIQDALEELKIDIEDAEIEIIDEGKSGFIGLGTRPAHIRVSIKHSPTIEAMEILDALRKKVDFKYEIDLIDSQMNINISGDNIGSLIGKKGATLNALQYIISISVNKKENDYINVLLDAENYRKKRKEILENLAISTASRVKKFKKTVHLEPMSSYDRRIVHVVLQNDKNVSTFSQGKDPFRNIVISPKGLYKKNEN